MIDFTIQDNFILTNGSIIAVFSIEPIDVILLPEQEQKAFETDIHRMLNSLGETHIQIIMRTRKAEPKDMDKHFRDLTTQDLQLNNKSTRSITTDLIQGYIHELSNLLENNIIPLKEYYIAFRQDVDTKNKAKLVEAVKKLDRTVERITGNLFKAGIKTKQIRNYDIVNKDGEERIINHRQLEKAIKSFIRL